MNEVSYILFLVAVIGWITAIHYWSQYNKAWKGMQHARELLFKATGLRDK